MIRLASIVFVAVMALSASVRAQENANQRPPDFTSPEVSAEKSVTFRIFAPNAKTVALASSDIPNRGGIPLTKAENGVWEAKVDSVASGAYRYSFNVDGVSVIDPKNTSTSESNANISSLVYVPGSPSSDLADVPHGSVAEVRYHSKTLNRFRRLHVYTPPKYENGQGQFPVLYLLHGAFDCDNSWSTVGRAGYILDNLIAAGKAKPMIIVMPAGHTGPFRFGGPRDDSFRRQMDEFTDDFVKEVKPLVEKNYRLLAGRSNRAIAGLSMGGAQTLTIAFGDLTEYGSIGVFSSGIFGINGGFGGQPPNTEWEDSHKAILDDASKKEGLKRIWFATGKEDFLLSTTQATVKMLKSHGFKVDYNETEGGHVWSNWREYLTDFASKLFVEN